MQTLLKKHSKWLSTFWVVMILTLSFLPGQSFPEVDFWNPDKLVHLFLYGVLAFLLGNVFFEKGKFVNRKRFIYLILICIGFGWGVEILQPIFTDRYYELYDVLANSVGAIMGSLILIYFLTNTKI